MPDLPKPETRIHAYEVSCLPFDNRDLRHFAYLIKRIEGDVWGVTEDGFHYWYDRHGDHGYGSDPTRRFTLDEAREVAEELARNATVNGWTVADALARIADREEE